MEETDAEVQDFNRVFCDLRKLSVELCGDEVSYENFLRGIASFTVALIADNPASGMVFPSFIAHMNELFEVVAQVRAENEKKEKSDEALPNSPETI